MFSRRRFVRTLLPLDGVSYLARARTHRREAQAGGLVGDDRHTGIARLRRSLLVAVPQIRAFCEATFLVGLRKAGVPEE
jgi:hypothetical protein